MQIACTAISKVYVQDSLVRSARESSAAALAYTYQTKCVTVAVAITLVALAILATLITLVTVVKIVGRATAATAATVRYATVS